MRWQSDFTIEDFDGRTYVDSRDVIARIEELEERDEDEEDTLDREEAAELRDLRDLAEECEGYMDDWRYGVALIPDERFVEYAEQLADDIGAIDRNAGWPLSYIDWEAAADALKQDYAEVMIRGRTYWGR